MMNQTGEFIQAFLTNRAGVDVDPAEKVPVTMRPGQIITRVRKANVTESVFVHTRLQYNSEDKFVNRPLFYLAQPIV